MGGIKLWIGAAAAFVVVTVAGFLVLLMVLISAVVGGSTSAANAAECLPPGIGTGGPEKGSTMPAEARAEQVKNAKLIDAAAQKAGFSGKGSRVAIIAAMGESTLLNLDYGDQVNGVTNSDGSAATSYGLFQQQTSQGWGTKEQVMDPEYATLSFLLGPKHDGKGGLSSVSNWEGAEDISAVIHTVQKNSDRGHYTRSILPAEGIMDEAEINVDRPADPDAKIPAQGGGENATVVVDGCGGGSGVIDPQDANDDYPFIAQTPGPGVYEEDGLGYFYGECTSFAAWRLNRDAGSTKSPFKYTSANGYSFGNAKDWKAAWLARGWKVSNVPVAGAIAYWDAYGGGTANDPLHGVGGAGHVAYVPSVTDDGKAAIEEYNNIAAAPPGHKYSMRTEPVDPSEVNAFLHPPPKDKKK